MIIQFLVSLAATLSFAVLFSAEKKQLFFCGLGCGGPFATDLNDLIGHDCRFDSVDRKSTRLNSSHASKSRMPSSA